MTAKPTSNPDHLPEGLTKGYRAFWTGRLKQEHERFRELAEHGQRPPVLLIGCCDSRVAPESIFEAGPGEIFVVRNIANLVPPYDARGTSAETASAIEYAVMALNVAHIVVLGHAQCGGIRAYAQGQQGGFQPLSEADFISHWKQLIAPAAQTLGPPTGDLAHYCEDLCRASVTQGLENLRTYPWIREREAAGTLSLHGAVFDISNGRLSALDPTAGAFVPVTGS